jgi:hypothetical protein
MTETTRTSPSIIENTGAPDEPKSTLQDKTSVSRRPASTSQASWIEGASARSCA